LVGGLRVYRYPVTRGVARAASLCVGSQLRKGGASWMCPLSPLTAEDYIIPILQTGKMEQKCEQLGALKR